jgi:hypothetical protein
MRGLAKMSCERSKHPKDLFKTDRLARPNDVCTPFARALAFIREATRLPPTEP